MGIKEKAPTFDRSLFDSRLQMRFTRGRHCNDYLRSCLKVPTIASLICDMNARGDIDRATIIY
jgi:hypothetical protein